MSKYLLPILVLVGMSFALVVNAEDATATAPANPPQTKVVSIADVMQLTDAQKNALQKIQQQRINHSRQMQIKYAELQTLSQAEKLDKNKIEDVADSMADMIKKFAKESTAAAHDFYASLTADQKKRMEEIKKKLKEQQQQQQPTNKKAAQ
jgi:Spy/CpxP family protein refolding chaperone